MADLELIPAARERLDSIWAEVMGTCATPPSGIPADVVEAIRESVNSPTKSYRYVLPTQLLAKVTNPKLNCKCLQAQSALPGAFDARSLCHKVIVPFDRANHNVLGGSESPYISNPLRIPELSSEHEDQQKDKAGFRRLQRVVEFAEADNQVADALLQLAMFAIRDRLALVRLTYPVPNRISLPDARDACAAFLAERTGGVRLQAVAVALFRSIGGSFGLFKDVESANINAADAATGRAADLECKDAAGAVVLAVEVKDRDLTIRAVEDKVSSVRAKGIREFVFLVQGGMAQQDVGGIQELARREFVTGQNLYVCEFWEFAAAVLVMLGEEGRRSFLIRIGEELDGRKVDLAHRLVWKGLLSRL